MNSSAFSQKILGVSPLGGMLGSMSAMNDTHQGHQGGTSIGDAFLNEMVNPMNLPAGWLSSTSQIPTSAVAELGNTFTMQSSNQNLQTAGRLAVPSLLDVASTRSAGFDMPLASSPTVLPAGASISRPEVTVRPVTKEWVETTLHDGPRHIRKKVWKIGELQLEEQLAADRLLLHMLSERVSQIITMLQEMPRMPGSESKSSFARSREIDLKLRGSIEVVYTNPVRPNYDLDLRALLVRATLMTPYHTNC